MARKPTKPKTRKAPAPELASPEPPDDGAERLTTDLRHQDELDCMRDRLYGLEAAILGVCDGDTPFNHGLSRLAADITEAMASCAAAFEAERQRRRAEKGNAAEASAPRQCHASEALSTGDLLAGCPKRRCEIDVSALQKMSTKELCDLREAIHTIEAVISSINCQPHFGEHMPNGLVDPNTAGDVLDNLSEFLSSYEQAVVNVAIATKPPTVEECRWRSWTILGFETNIAEDLASFAVLAAEAARDKAKAEFQSSRALNVPAE